MDNISDSASTEAVEEIELADRSKYSGEVLSGKLIPHGVGCMVTPEGAIYEGQWYKGK